MGTVFGLLFAGTGLFLLIRGLLQFRSSKASRDWPTIEGQVTQAMVDMSIDRDEDGSSSRKYAPLVIYTYAILGREYTSDQVAFGSKWRYTSRAKAESKLRYQSGEQVIVYYNPENPTQTVLEPGAVGGAWGTLLIGIVFIIVGGFVLFNTVQGIPMK
ncbi:MAG: DUF3592 domain-containing protein [Anaerolineaceae bacterium]|nr:DUF3592 domain-containing protein [Anaerolineaceae bacterium]